MPRVIVFDVNETLLNVRALAPHFERTFGDPVVLKHWFSQMLQNALVATITDRYQDFGTMGAAALDMTAEREGVVVSEEDRNAILAGMRTLPPHPEVKESLERLKQAGLRLAALTNSTGEVAHAQLNHAGIAPYFEQVMSVEMAGKFKPAREVYLKAAERLGVAPTDMRMVAAHNWDTTGAIRAGCAAAFVARPGMVLGPTDEQLDIIGADLLEVAGRIIYDDVNRGTVSHAS